MKKQSFYALVQGRYYEGDIEGQRYHWKKGIPGSKQLAQDLKKGKEVSFVYYRTWDKETNKGKYFYGSGFFDNQSLKEVKTESNKIDYFSSIKDYKPFPTPLIVEEMLRKRVWPGAHRQAGIKKISKDIFNVIVDRGMNPKRLYGLAVMIGEHNIEGLLNDQINSKDIKDSEGVNAVKRTATVEIYKRAKKVIKDLKKQYKGVCQITGEKLTSLKNFGVDVTEGHHIKYLCNNGLDADPSNIIIIGPEWHRLIHKENPKLDREKLTFVFNNGNILPIQHPGHLAKDKN